MFYEVFTQRTFLLVTVAWNCCGPMVSPPTGSSEGSGKWEDLLKLKFLKMLANIRKTAFFATSSPIHFLLPYEKGCSHSS